MHTHPNAENGKKTVKAFTGGGNLVDAFFVRWRRFFVRTRCNNNLHIRKKKDTLRQSCLILV